MKTLLVMLTAVLTAPACNFQKHADQKFGDQHFKTAVALIELHRTRTGEYPVDLDDIQFTGDWDGLHLHSVSYEKLTEGYQLDLAGGWVSTPDLEFPADFWQGLGVRRTNVKGLPPATRPELEPGPEPDPTACDKDEDCVLSSFDCSPCGRCPGPLPAVSKQWLAHQQATCEFQQDPARQKPVVQCACPAPELDTSKWPTRAVCVKHTCQPR